MKKTAPNSLQHRVKRIRESGLFDTQFYLETYKDVAQTGLDPIEHFIKFGAQMGRDPSRDFSTRFYATNNPVVTRENLNPLIHFINQQKKGKGITPDATRVLLGASQVAQFSGVDAALKLAKRHLPAKLQYTMAVLRGNAALDAGNETEWLAQLNSYLTYYDAAPIQLSTGKSELFSRFMSSGLPEVSGGPLISVIMPAWNAQDTIEMAAASILSQTWRNLELLIVDDCSTDNTWAKLQKIAARDARVKVLRNKVNVGPYVSKNIAMSMANGEWITGHDADDWALPQRLEHHMGRVLKQSKAPRASIPCMLRLLPNGSFDRFSAISHFCIDGIAREAPIACLFQADFLKNALGSWDGVRFGADSEMISRVKSLIGEEFKRFDQISMFAMSAENSLTNHPEHGVSRTAGPSQIRQDYAAAWKEWHKTLSPRTPEAARLSFPQQGDRKFSAPHAATVPVAHIRRNYAAMTGQGIEDTPVTAICCSKRPGFLEHISGQLLQQNHPNLHVIFVAHGPGHDQQRIKECFGALQSITVLELPDPEATLGEALNMALEACQTDIVTKIDDDDFYGPNYIRSSLAALMHREQDDIGIVGHARAYCYVEDTDNLYLRFDAKKSNRLMDRVFGGTIFWSRQALDDQRFQHLPRAVDSAFFKDAQAKGVKIMSIEAEDYIHVRYALLTAHTWQPSTDEFLRPATQVAEGLRLDVAWSSQHEPSVGILPQHD